VVLKIIQTTPKSKWLDKFSVQSTTKPVYMFWYYYLWMAGSSKIRWTWRNWQVCQSVSIF